MIQIAKPQIDIAEIKSVSKVLLNGQLSSGRYVKEFEKLFKQYIGSKYAIATCNGTAALHTALLAVGISTGDNVITTPFSFIATANAIRLIGGNPIFADIDEDSFNIDPKKIELEIKESKERIKAMVIVHLFGKACNMNEIKSICDKYEILLIEDCAQAHGAEYNNQKVGTFGAASIFSFYPTKNMTCGEGGIILTNSKEIYEKSKLIINHGQNSRYNHTIMGYNYRMTDIAAAIGIEQLKKLEEFNHKRIQNAKAYFRDIDNPSICLPHVDENSKHVFNQFTIKCKNRISLINHLDLNNIGYGIYYPNIIPNQPLYKSIGFNKKYKNAEAVCQSVISLPVHPSLEQFELKRIIDTLNSYEYNPS